MHEDEPYDGKTTRVKDGDTISIGEIKGKIIHTPGHTPGGMCILFDTKLITGDSLFVEGCGRVDFEGGNVDQMWESLQKLKALDETIEVYPGHDYGSIKHSTIKHEKEHNRFMLCKTKEEFLKKRLN